MKRRLLLALLALLAVAALAPVQKASALPGNCFSNPRLDYQFFEGQALCIGAGDGCTFCNEVGRRGEGSWDLCYFSVRTGDMTCYSMN